LRNKASTPEYLAFLSAKYEVDPDKLFHALISAGRNQRSTCGNLSIRCRGKPQRKTVFLITEGSKVVAQFPIPEEFLLEGRIPIKNLRKTNMPGRHLIEKSKEPHPLHIRDLRTGMKKVSLKARVLEIPRPTFVFTRFGEYAGVANALIADETGTIKLCLWNEQISSISVGATVQIVNAHVSTFRGERQLRIGRNGMLSIVETINAH